MSTATATTDTLRRGLEGDEKEAKPHPTVEVEDDAISQEDIGNISGAANESDELEHVDSDEVPHKTEPTKPRIRYRVEYRNRWTNDLLSHRIHDGCHDLDTRETDNPIFEVVTSYRILPDTDTDLAVNSAALPTYQLRIYSIALINAIQSVVRYYPGQDLSGEYITVPWPYPVLVHHYDELEQFGQDCLSKTQDQLCTRETSAAAHIRVLLEYLDQEVMREVREEQERNKKGYETYDWRWVAQKPGVTVLYKSPGNDNWHAYVIHSAGGGTLENPPKPWTLRSWKIGFDGFTVRRVWRQEVAWFKFDGERKMVDGDYTIKYIDPKSSDQLLKNDEICVQLIRNGQRFVEMLEPKCYEHRVEGADLSSIGVSSLQVSIECT